MFFRCLLANETVLLLVFVTLFPFIFENAESHPFGMCEREMIAAVSQQCFYISVSSIRCGSLSWLHFTPLPSRLDVNILAKNTV